MSLFGESLRDRELRETRESWIAAEALRAKRPLLDGGVGTLGLALFLHLHKILGRMPNGSIYGPLLDATIQVLDGEELGEVEPNWAVVASDVSEAVRLRTLIARRRRWLSEWDTRLADVQRYLLGTWKVLIQAMPESCFREPDEGGIATFDVPLVEVLPKPAELIEGCVVFAFAEPFVRGEMFDRLRGQLRRNLLRASGLSVEADFAKVRGKIVMPTQAAGKSPAELVALYLRDTPFAQVFEAPAPFSVPDETRFEHGHILGGTGAGKTQLLQRMIHADLTRAGDGRSVVVIDSQGDLISKLVRLDLFAPEHPESLADRLVLIDPTDVEHPPALNLFDAHLDRVRDYRPADRERVLNGVVELYETMFGDMLGAELTQKQGVVFRYLARLMLAIPNANIYTLMELMEDGRAFSLHMKELDGSARHFFEREFFHPSFAATKKQILRRLWGVLSTPAFERMFAQPSNKLDLFEATRDGKIILISTAKELLKREGSSLLGRFFVHLLAQAALERSVLPIAERTPTFVYVDEAQEYFDDNVETILQQARKYRIGLVAAHQSLDQATPGLRSALLSNTSFKCASGVSAKDARVLGPELRTTPEFIEGMRRRGDTTEFAAWVKNETPSALRLTVPLGYLERQPVMREEAYDYLLEQNRERYCGSLEQLVSRAETEPPPEEVAATTGTGLDAQTEADMSEPAPAALVREDVVREPSRPASSRTTAAPRETQELGKGGKKHRYLQNLVKGLAEDLGFKATIEAAVPGGQVDVLLEKGSETVAVEISVSTPVEWERQNLRKCLAATSGPVALVLAKSDQTARRYREAVVEGLEASDLTRLTVLYPEALPDYLAGLSPAPEPEAVVVKGYRVKIARTPITAEEAAARRETLARLVAQSLGRQSD